MITDFLNKSNFKTFNYHKGPFSVKEITLLQTIAMPETTGLLNTIKKLFMVTNHHYIKR